MLHIVWAVEGERLAVRAVVLEHTVRADVVQQRAEHGLTRVEVARRDDAARHAVGRGHGERALHRFAGAFGRVRGQRAAAHEQRVAPVDELAGDLRDNHAVGVNEVVCGVGGREFAVERLDLVHGGDDSCHAAHRSRAAMGSLPLQASLF